MSSIWYVIEIIVSKQFLPEKIAIGSFGDTAGNNKPAAVEVVWAIMVAGNLKFGKNHF